MIRHIVILHFQKKHAIDYLALLEKTRPLIEPIPGILKYSLNKNESKYVPEHVTSIGVEVLFKDQQALETFMDHPKHYEAKSLAFRGLEMRTAGVSTEAESKNRYRFLLGFREME